MEAFYPGGPEVVGSRREQEEPEGACELCGRAISPLSKHHLIPVTRHAKRRKKKPKLSHEELHKIAFLCRPCHDNIHATFTEKELEVEYNTIEALAAHPDIARHTRWIATKPDGFGAHRAKFSQDRRSKSRRRNSRR